MIGTLVNTGTVIAGSLVGLAIGDRLPEKIKSSVLTALGLITMWIGVTMVIRGTRPLLIVSSLICGGVIGELLAVERRLERVGDWLKARSGSQSGGFVRGFVSASLLFCVGPMTIVGSIQDGTTGDATLLLTKSVMDGFAAIALAATTGIGVLFSALTVLGIQGGLTLLGRWLAALTVPAALDQLSCVGGLIILGLSLRLLGLKEVPVANYLPALVIIALAVVLI
ncbi:MAG: DUF554 domain-containing protein [candidate division Zixibacteria bacterium]|nr:DUF554 domain-containing protein [candidate division Zixibacteria bacterium]